MKLRLMGLLGIFWIVFAVACSDDTSKSKKQTPMGTCGNGALDPGETCDPTASNEGACPESCSAPACTTATLTGSADACSARCIVEPIACTNGDSCCPLGCDSTNDTDCTNTCGDGTTEAPESCDGDCPTACASDEACQAGSLLGSADTCSVRCDFEPIRVCEDGDGCCLPGCVGEDDDCNTVSPGCGNGMLDEGETCDGDCPTSCERPNACVISTLTGSAETCDAVCVTAPLTTCQNDDGCCPMLCSAGNDNDCSGSCGNGMLDVNETCDGNCPTSCNDSIACTVDTMLGSPTNCNVQCVYDALTVCQSGDGCCPAGCDFDSDSDCNCQPKTCAQQGVACGLIDDTCGQQIDCGGCPSGEGCAGGMCSESAGIGAACTSDADCGADGTNTITCNLMAPGGYCTNLCLPMAGLACPAGSSCSLLDAVLQTSCAKICANASDCRDGYTCTLDIFGGTSLCVPS